LTATSLYPSTTLFRSAVGQRRLPIKGHSPTLPQRHRGGPKPPSRPTERRALPTLPAVTGPAPARPAAPRLLGARLARAGFPLTLDRKSTRLNSSHVKI